jgi:Zn-dependent protease with chaperone function
MNESKMDRIESWAAAAFVYPWFTASEETEKVVIQACLRILLAMSERDFETFLAAFPAIWYQSDTAATVLSIPSLARSQTIILIITELETTHPDVVQFILAHEMAHVVLGHQTHVDVDEAAADQLAASWGFDRPGTQLSCR